MNTGTTNTTLRSGPPSFTNSSSQSTLNSQTPNINLLHILVVSKHKLVRWFFFSVVGSLLPLILSYLLALIDKSKPFNLALAISHGELLLISIGISCGTVGEMFGLGNRYFKTTKIISGSLGFLSYVVQSLFYTCFSYLSQSNVNALQFKKISIIFFILTLIISVSHLVLSEVE